MGLIMKWQDRLTLVITTSPVKSNPDTALIEEVMQSILLCPGLEECRKIIVCDGVNQIAEEKKPLWKSGRVNHSHVPLYSEYKDNLRILASHGVGAFQNTEIKELESRSGFGLAARLGVGDATTEYVMVIQHDRRFNRFLDVEALIADMDLARKHYSPTNIYSPFNAPRGELGVVDGGKVELNEAIMSKAQVRYPMNYVCLPTTYTMNYSSRLATKYSGIEAERHSLPCPNLARSFLNSFNTIEIPSGAEDPESTKPVISEEEITRILSSTLNTRTPQPHSHPELYDVSSLNKPVTEMNFHSPRLTPMAFWYDSTHIARKDFYENVIFGRYLRKKVELVRTGEFIEDKLIQFSNSIFQTAIENGRNDGTIRTRNMIDEERRSTIDDVEKDATICNPTQSHMSSSVNAETAVQHTQDTLNIWNVHEHRFTKDRDLRNYGQWLVDQTKINTSEAALDLLQHEFGLWLLEDYQGRTYNIRGAWVLPKWLQSKVDLVRKIFPKIVSSTHKDGSGSVHRLHPSLCPLFFAPDNEEEELIQMLDSTPSSSSASASASALRYIAPRGYLCTDIPGRPLVGHLDGKKFWNQKQRETKGYRPSVHPGKIANNNSNTSTNTAEILTADDSSSSDESSDSE